MARTIRDKSNKLPSASQLIKPGYEAFGVNLFLYVAVMLLPALVVLPLGLDNTQPDKIESLSDILTQQNLAMLAASLCTFPALTFLQLKSARGEVVKPTEALRTTRTYFVRLVLLQLTVATLVALGLLLFIIPGLYVLRRYFLAVYYLLDDNCTIMKALKKSSKDSSMYARSIWGLIGLGMLITLGLTIPFVNIVATFLMFSYAFAPALRYHQIRADLGWTFDQKAIPPSKQLRTSKK